MELQLKIPGLYVELHNASNASVPDKPGSAF